MSKTIKKLYLSAVILGAVSVFVASANADFTTLPNGNVYGEFTVASQFVVTKTNYGRHGTLTLDLSGYDIDLTKDNFKFDFSSFLETQLRLQSAASNGVYAQAGEYGGFLMYGLDIKTGNGVSLGPNETLPGNTPFYNMNTKASYNIDETLFFPDARIVYDVTPHTITDIGYDDWVANVNIGSLLDENNSLTITFDFYGTIANVMSFPEGTSVSFNREFTTSIILQDIVASGEVKFYATASPEPASFVIFGTASLLGLPFIRRLRRKNLPVTVETPVEESVME